MKYTGPCDKRACGIASHLAGCIIVATPMGRNEKWAIVAGWS